MKLTRSSLAQLYEKALILHIQQRSMKSLKAAVALGQHAITLKMDTLALARMHETVLAHLVARKRTRGPSPAAYAFFHETNAAMGSESGPTHQNKLDLKRLHVTLNQRTLELAATNRQLRLGIVRRRAAEAALKLSGEHYTQLLQESLQLQNGLRQLAHKVLKVQEDERNKISMTLREEIAQTLLGIHVRLLSMKREAQTNSHGLKKAIAGTQQLVAESVRSFRQVAAGI